MKKIAYKKEPVLKESPNWIVTVTQLIGVPATATHHCANMRAVECVKRKAPEGSEVRLYKVIHNFVAAWQK